MSNYHDPRTPYFNPQPATHGAPLAIDPAQHRQDQLRQQRQRDYQGEKNRLGEKATNNHPPNGLMRMIESYSSTLSDLELTIKSLYKRLEPVYVDPSHGLNQAQATYGADAAPPPQDATPVSSTVAHLRSLNVRLDLATRALRQIEAGLNI